MGGAKLHPNASTMLMASNLLSLHTYIYACAGSASEDKLGASLPAGPGSPWS